MDVSWSSKFHLSPVWVFCQMVSCTLRNQTRAVRMASKIKLKAKNGTVYIIKMLQLREIQNWLYVGNCYK